MVRFMLFHLAFPEEALRKSLLLCDGAFRTNGDCTATAGAIVATDR